jgi:hypothetical protein
VLSVNARESPDAVKATAALQVLAPAVQLMSPAGQDAGGVTAVAQVVDAGALQAPLLQEYDAAPVVGAEVSCNTAVEPEVVSAAVELQVLVPTVQLKAVAAHEVGAGITQVADAGALHAPLLQE